MFEKFPYSNFHDLNLDWILKKLKEFEEAIQGLSPDTLVRSVNGKTGEVVLRAADVDAVSNKETVVTLQPTQSDTWSIERYADGQRSGIEFGINEDGELRMYLVTPTGSETVYTSANEPDYPVTSVNGQTGDVTISVTGAVTSVQGRTGAVLLRPSDINGLNIAAAYYADPGDSILDFSQQELRGFYADGMRLVLTNEESGSNYSRMYILDRLQDGMVTYSQFDPAISAGTVNSVNGYSGDVTLTASDVGAMPAGYVAPVRSVNNKTGAVVLTAADVNALPSNYVAPVQSVNGKNGNVDLTAADVGALPTSYKPVLVVSGTTAAGSALTITNSAITPSMVVVECVIENRDYQSGDWTCTTSSGTLTVGPASAISGATQVTITLAEAK